MSAPPPDHPYRARPAWAEVRMLVTPARPAAAAQLREELKRLREMVTAGEVPQDPVLIAATVTALTSARDSIRRYARPIYAILRAIAAALTGASLLLRWLTGPFGMVALCVGVGTGLLAAWMAAYLVQPWLDLLPEYEGLMGDLRRYAEKIPASRDKDRLAALGARYEANQGGWGPEAMPALLKNALEILDRHATLSKTRPPEVRVDVTTREADAGVRVDAPPAAEDTDDHPAPGDSERRSRGAKS